MRGIRLFAKADLLADGETKRHRLQSLPQVCIPDRQRTTAAGRSWPATTPALLLASRLAFRAGALHFARQLTKLAVVANPASLAANRLAAQVEQRQGDIPAELAYRNAAAEMDDSRRRGHWELAKTLLRLDRQNLAVPSKASRSRFISALQTASTSTDVAIRTAANVALSDALREAGNHT